MGYICRGICNKFKVSKFTGNKIYETGARRCQICDCYLEWEGYWCPCCGNRLRTKPHKSDLKGEMIRI